MDSVRVFIAILSSVIGVACYAPYIRHVLLGQTTPHTYSWLVWTLLQIIGAAAMLSGGAGAGALFLMGGAALSGFIFVLSLRNGTHDITMFDTVCLIGAFSGMGAYFFMRDPLYSVLAISFTEFMAFVPTWRKAYAKPDSETLLTYALSAVSSALALFALSAITFTTVLYPLSITITNTVCSAIIIRRKRMNGFTLRSMIWRFLRRSSVRV